MLKLITRSVLPGREWDYVETRPMPDTVAILVASVETVSHLYLYLLTSIKSVYLLHIKLYVQENGNTFFGPIIQQPSRFYPIYC